MRPLLLLLLFAAALNRIAGARATRGNDNEPENIGAFWSRGAGTRSSATTTSS